MSGMKMREWVYRKLCDKKKEAMGIQDHDSDEERMKAQKVKAVSEGRRRFVRENQEKGGDIMPISTQYAILSEDKATILLPKDVQQWVSDAERFVVVIENDELILRKTHSRRSLDVMVTREIPPISSEDLDSLIHEIRK